MNDPRLWKAYHEGKRDAFDKLWARHEPTLRARAHQLCHGLDEAVEAALRELSNKLADAATQRSYHPACRWIDWACRVLKEFVLNPNRLQLPYHQGSRNALNMLWGRYKPRLLAQALGQCGGRRDAACEAMTYLWLKLADPQKQQSYDPARRWLAWARAVLTNLIIDKLRSELGRCYYRLGKRAFDDLRDRGVPESILARLEELSGKQLSEDQFQQQLAALLSPDELAEYGARILEVARHCRQTDLMDPQQAGRVADAAGMEPWKQAFLREFREALEDCFELLTPEEQIIVRMRDWLGLRFVEIAEWLYRQRKESLVTGKYYRAHRKIKACLEQRGFGKKEGDE